jgi:hypothetical protein
MAARLVCPRIPAGGVAGAPPQRKRCRVFAGGPGVADSSSYRLLLRLAIRARMTRSLTGRH